MSDTASYRLLILVGNLPAFYFLFEISYLLGKNVPVRGTLSDLKSQISALLSKKIPAAGIYALQQIQIMGIFVKGIIGKNIF